MERSAFPIAVVALFSGIWLGEVANAGSKDEACAWKNAFAAGLRGYIYSPNLEPVPAVQFFDVNGAPRSIKDYSGRAVVLNFWATWCLPCAAEMPALDRLAARVRALGIDVIAINEDRKEVGPVEAFYQNHGLENLEILIDRFGALMKSTKFVQLPSTMLIDQQGNEIAVVLEPAEWDDEYIVAFLRKCLGND